MRIVSWNINGIRAAAKKGLTQWLAATDADVIGLQEVRAGVHQIPEELRERTGWHTHWSAAERPGYSGTGMYSKLKPSALETSLGKKEFDVEGRAQIAQFGKLIVANIYFPNGSGKDRDNSRVPYKLEFYRRLFDVLEKDRKRGRPILVIGDFNIAHKEIDLARPKANETTSGFLPEERAELDRWVNAGWVDTFRHFEPGPDRYSWWSQRGGARARNIGWRIDYVMASEGAMAHLKGAAIHPEVTASDHCPISVEVDEKI